MAIVTDQPTATPYGGAAAYPGPTPPPRRRGSRLLAALPLLATGAIGVLATILLAFSAPGQAYDERALDTITGAGTELNERLIDQLQLVDHRSTALGVLALVVLALFRGRFRVGLAAGVLVLGANVTTQLVKEVLTRPDLGYGATESLPSGHTTVIFSLALAAVLVSPRRLRWLVALVGGAVGGLGGVATVIAGWHRPSDAIAALFVTAAWEALASLIAGRPRDGVRGHNGLFPALFGAGLAAVGVIIYGFGWMPGDDATRVIPFTVLAILGVAGLMTGGYSRLVSRTSN